MNKFENKYSKQIVKESFRDYDEQIWDLEDKIEMLETELNNNKDMYDESDLQDMQKEIDKYKSNLEKLQSEHEKEYEQEISQLPQPTDKTEFDGFRLDLTEPQFYTDFIPGNKNRDYMMKKYNLRNTYITEMTPKEYLELCGKYAWKKAVSYEDVLKQMNTEQDQETINWMVEQIKSGEKLPLPFLDVKRSSQEGRHRALAAEKVGLKTIPVLIMESIDKMNNDKVIMDWNGEIKEFDTPEQAIKYLDEIIEEYEADHLEYCADVFKELRDDILDGKRKIKYDSLWLESAYEQDEEESYHLNENKDKRIKEGPYKDGMGKWTIDLADGYETDYGTTYIQRNTKKECMWELENNVISNKIEESNNKVKEWVDKEIEEALGWSKKDKMDYVESNLNKYIRQLGQKINKAQYDNERNKLKANQDFYKEALAELNKRLNIKTESKKLQEASRNELLAITKKEHDLRSKKRQEQDPNNPNVSNRYERSAGYKGFGIVNVDTTNLLRGNTLVVTLKVGDYEDTVELEDVLYWIQITAEDKHNTTPRQVNSKVVTQALNNAIDGMNINVDCTCKDWYYRLAYQATLLGYKYGEKVNIPNGGPPKHDQRANPDNYGALCKHLYAVLTNKSWIQQVTKTLMNWFDENINKVNVYLGLVADKQLVMPDADIRQLGKSGAEQRKINDELRRREVVKNYFTDYMKNIQNNLVDMTDDEVAEDLDKWVSTTAKRFKITDEEYKDMLQQLIDYKTKHTPSVKGNNPSTNNYNNVESEEDNNEEQ